MKRHLPLWLGVTLGIAALAAALDTGNPRGAGPASWAGDLTPITAEEWISERAAHLLERAGFGGTPAEVEALAALSPEKAVAHLVDYEGIDASSLADFEESGVWSEAMLPDLDEGDLKMTTDFRSVYGTMIKEWMGYDETKSVLKGDFPTLGIFA